METIKNAIRWVFYPLTYKGQLKMPKLFAATVYVIIATKIYQTQNISTEIHESWIWLAVVAGLIREGSKAWPMIEKLLTIWKGKK